MHVVDYLKNRIKYLADWNIIIEDICSNQVFQHYSRVFYPLRSTNNVAHDIAKFNLNHCITGCWLYMTHFGKKKYIKCLKIVIRKHGILCRLTKTLDRLAFWLLIFFFHFFLLQDATSSRVFSI